MEVLKVLKIVNKLIISMKFTVSISTEEMFPDCIKEKKTIKGINYTMFRGLEWNPTVVYPKEPKNFAYKKPEQTKKMGLNF